MKKMFFTILILMFYFVSFSQNGTLLVISNQNATVKIDGVTVGEVISNIPKKFEISKGEHYFQAFYETGSGSSMEHSEVIDIVENVQKVLKIEFDKNVVKTNANNLKDTLNITNLSFKAPSLDVKSYYYSFAAGDEIIANLSLKEKKGSFRLEIVEYPSNTVYTKSGITNSGDIKLQVKNDGIYVFKIITDGLIGRDCNMIIKRICSSDKTNFNTSVGWRTINDTTFYNVEEKYLVNIDTIPIDIIPQRIERVVSSNALNREPNKTYFSFNLPDNTIFWAYFIGTGADAKSYLTEAEAKASKMTANLQTGANVAKSITTATANPYSAVAYLALSGMSLFGGGGGKGSNVQYWFVDSDENAKLFMAGQPFYQFDKGNSAISYKRMQGHPKGTVYLCLYNDNLVDAIDVYISISAITAKENWNVRTVKKYNVNSYEEPYIKY